MTNYSSPTQPSPLWKWLQNFEPELKSLSWCHTTDAYRLMSIIKKGKLSPQICPVFHESLAYFFYGRPAYRRNDNQQIRLTSKAPVIIVLRPEIIEIGSRIFPFDSGAFPDRYAQWLHPDMRLRDFELECPSNAPQRFVSAFFKNNENYLKVIPNETKPATNGIFEVESVSELLRDPNAEPADDRRLAVELQVRQEIRFDSHNVSALILPDELMAADWFESFMELSGAGIRLCPYKMQPLKTAGNYQTKLEDIAIELQDIKTDSPNETTIE